MKTRLLFGCLAIFVASTANIDAYYCGRSVPLRVSRETLSLKKANALAAVLANQEAKRKFGVKPFSERDGKAVLRDGRWEWMAKAGVGKGDLSARVSFWQDGSDRKIEVFQLWNER